MSFKLKAPFSPSGDQPEAIKLLLESIAQGTKDLTLLGVTGSGKTFTIANVLQTLNRPTLILSHNKTLAAQLYSEFKDFFPNNAVEYFVSYYDYYQPEAYIPATNTYIEKDLAINDEIEKLRLKTTSSLLSGRRDVIVVSSVSCIYGIGNPEEFMNNTIHIQVQQQISRNKLLRLLVNSLYSRTEQTLEARKFRVKGDTVDIFPGYGDIAYRIIFWEDEIEHIESFDPVSGGVYESMQHLVVYPADIFIISPEKISNAIREIQIDLRQRIDHMNDMGKNLEAKRLQDRVSYDLEMIRELGYCSGIENYSRYFDGRPPYSRPFCLLDYFPSDFLTIIDESHVTVPQVRGMYEGDRARKLNLVDYGFRLPSALDNRPLKFTEFQSLLGQTVYISATPADYELEKSGGVIIEQVVRPTGLLDPSIEVRPCENQIDDLLEEIETTVQKKERVLVTTLTKRMAEDLCKYLTKINIQTEYIHSDIDTINRVEILDRLRSGVIDVLVGVNLLREGLDLPEVSLVAILDADKEGFLRSERALTQTAGRAARNVNGRVIFYADKITTSMKKTMDETNRRREKQIAYNIKHNITPTTIERTRSSSIVMKPIQNEDHYSKHIRQSEENKKPGHLLSEKELDNLISSKRKVLELYVKELDFLKAAQLRDEIEALKKRKKKNENG
ncbi:MAG: excinuclease ABC subunit UvrB [Bacteroidales bacterium]|jgi:excinuclease ABC subunit B|nr:excinuclease ABC subunit UvrB [Bacteroidales bacterium]